MPIFLQNQEHKSPRVGIIYRNSQTSVNSYMPRSSVYGTPAGAYIKHVPDGSEARQELAVPTDNVPDGQEVATVIFVSFPTEIYPDGHDVLGATATAGTDKQQKNKIILFIFITRYYYLYFQKIHLRYFHLINSLNMHLHKAPSRFQHHHKRCDKQRN